MPDSQPSFDHPTPESSPNPYRLGLVHFSGMLIGCAVGLMLGNRLGRDSKPIVASTLAATGLVLLSPLAIIAGVKRYRRPHSDRNMQRRLQSIREGATFEDVDNLP